MKRQAVEFDRIQLKCDAQGCDHVETVPEMEASLIGKPCPKCGANLLTQEDYEKAKALETLAAIVNELIGPIDGPESPRMRVSVNPHGDNTNIQFHGIEH